MLRNELYAMDASPDELHLFDWFGASHKVTKIGRNIYPLLDAVSLCCWDRDVNNIANYNPADRGSKWAWPKCLLYQKFFCRLEVRGVEPSILCNIRFQTKEKVGIIKKNYVWYEGGRQHDLGRKYNKTSDIVNFDLFAPICRTIMIIKVIFH